MEMALRLARWGLGKTAPNPSVGCVLVKDEKVVGRGWTGYGGRPHAEQIAIERAGKQTIDATAYITLEPCAHQGVTPPCVDTIIEAGISKAVIAVMDPDPRVSGRGIKKLETAGINVVTGVCADQALELNAGFFAKTTEERPFVTIKVASTADGFIATRNGDSKWITSPKSREWGHLLRSENDAVLVGIGTVLSDNPSLTVRLPGLYNTSPIRIVLDNNLRTPLGSKLVSSAKEVPTWLLTTKDLNSLAHRKMYEQSGVEIVSLGKVPSGQLGITNIFKVLAKRGVTRLLVEGGSKVTGSFLRSQLVDEIYWFRSVKILGENNISAVAELGIKDLANAPRFILKERKLIVDETLEVYKRK